MKLFPTKSHERAALRKLWLQTDTVHSYPRNVDRCCTSFVNKVIIDPFVLLNINHLMTGPHWNSKFCFPPISMFPSTSSRQILRFSGNKIHCFPRDPSLSVKCRCHYVVYVVMSLVWTGLYFSSSLSKSNPIVVLRVRAPLAQHQETLTKRSADSGNANELS